MKHLRTLHISPALLIAICMIVGVVFTAPFAFGAGGSGSGDGSGDGSGSGSGDGDGGTTGGPGNEETYVSCENPQAWPWGVNCAPTSCNVNISPSDGPDPRMVWWNGTSYNPMNWAIDGVWQPGVIGSGQYINFAGYGGGSHTLTIQSQPGEYMGQYCADWLYGQPNLGVCVTSVDAYRVYSCSTNFSNPASNLTSSNVQLSDNATYIPAGTNVSFTARVNNVGTVDVSGFSDEFRYYVNPSGPWQTISTVSSPSGLSANSSKTDTSAPITFWTPGSQLVEHCVDSLGQVAESNEGDNCSQRLYEVTSPITVSCSASPASIDEGESTTWTASASGGSGTYSYQWSGTDGLSGSGVSISKTYGASGSKTASVIVTDGFGRSSGSVNCSTTVTVVDTDPVADIRARVLGSGAGWSNGPLTISAADEVELEWSSTNASSCTGDTYYSTGGATSGTTGAVAEAAAGESRSYRVTCERSGLSDQDTVVVNRSVPALPPTLTATPNRVRQGETTTLSGNLNDHTGCTITGGSTNISVPDGTGAFSYTSAAILGETTLTLDCALGEASEVVRILPEVEHF